MIFHYIKEKRYNRSNYNSLLSSSIFFLIKIKLPRRYNKNHALPMLLLVVTLGWKSTNRDGSQICCQLLPQPARGLMVYFSAQIHVDA